MGPFKRPGRSSAAQSLQPSDRGSSSSSRVDSREKKKQHRPNRRDPEEQVSRLIEDRLPGISQVQLTQQEVKGQNLLSRITADHADISARGGRLSGIYWTKLRAEYVRCGVWPSPQGPQPGRGRVRWPVQRPGSCQEQQRGAQAEEGAHRFLRHLYEAQPEGDGRHREVLQRSQDRWQRSLGHGTQCCHEDFHQDQSPG